MLRQDVRRRRRRRLLETDDAGDRLPRGADCSAAGRDGADHEGRRRDDRASRLHDPRRRKSDARAGACTGAPICFAARVTIGPGLQSCRPARPATTPSAGAPSSPTRERVLNENHSRHANAPRFRPCDARARGSGPPRRAERHRAAEPDRRQAGQHHLRGRAVSVSRVVPAADALRAGRAHGVHGRGAAGGRRTATPWCCFTATTSPASTSAASIDALRKEGFRVDRARSDRLRPIVEADHPVQLQRHGAKHAR